MTSAAGGRRRRLGTFRTRLAGRLAVLTAVVFALGAVAALALMRRALVAHLDATLLRVAAIEAATLRETPAEAMRFHEGVFDAPAVLPTGTAERRDDDLMTVGRYAQVWSLEGRIVLRSRSLGPCYLPEAPAALAAAARNEVVVADGRWAAGALRSVYLPLARLGTGHDRHILQVAAPLAPVESALAVLAWTLAALGVAATVVALVGGAALAGRAIAPARAVAEQAEAITAGSLGARIHAEADAVEYDRLVAVLNAMLARLDGAFAAQRRFVADASHEIRHPLATLRAGLELALRRERSAAEYRTALGDAVVQVARVGEIADALLLLARIDAGVLQPRRLPTDLTVLAAAAAARASAFAATRVVRVVVAPGEGRTIAAVDPTLLGRALDNLVDNAVRASPPGGVVEVQVRGDARGVDVAVLDAGGGVAPEHRARLFERFFRADPARAVDQGTGLGLAIVRGIAEAHGGRVSYWPRAGDRRPRDADASAPASVPSAVGTVVGTAVGTAPAIGAGVCPGGIGLPARRAAARGPVEPATSGGSVFTLHLPAVDG